MLRKKDNIPFETALKHHVRDKMAKHKKIKKHGVIRDRKFRIEDELAEAETEREENQSMHDLVGTGMELLFPDALEIISRLDERVGRDNDILHESFQRHCKERVSDMELDDVEDLIYFMQLLDNSTGAWYWHQAKPALQEAVDDRLTALGLFQEENEDE